MIRTIYQHLLPLGVRTAAGQCRNRCARFYWQRVKPIMWSSIYVRLVGGSARAHRKRVARLRGLLRNGEPLRVVFEVNTLAKWKADSLLAAMQRHPRFAPAVWLVPYYNGSKALHDEHEHQECRKYFSNKGIRVVSYEDLESFPADEKPDLLFPNEPYDVYVYGAPWNQGLGDYLFCFLPYGFTSTDSPRNYNQIINNCSLFAFYENAPSMRTARRVMTNRGVNARLTGQPFADSFLFPWDKRPHAWKDCGSGMKRVIWAPHWTISSHICWLRFGTFLSTGEILLEMAEKYRNKIQFAFKPHPLLFDTLCNNPEWGRERAEAFYAKWREMPNTQLEHGAYTDLFMQSDAMIHDCGSFIQEYLFADKPCMYLRDGAGYQGYSDMALDCLNAYQIGITREEIEEFLQMVLRGEDPKAEVRRQLREKYLVPPHGQSAAQNIIDCLLMQERHG